METKIRGLPNAYPSSITKENIDIIIKMREDNIPVEKIAYYTGIPKEIIVSI
ncbi:hypothetical protein [Phocaeicola dorei]|uniref:hypothetical protein n=1 Tax=Phocaeicola dorei TaxID=357276 RepID=UPI002E7770DC|nr:hypothetical protein [Phocaeicola dorei]